MEEYDDVENIAFDGTVIKDDNHFDESPDDNLEDIEEQIPEQTEEQDTKEIETSGKKIENSPDEEEETRRMIAHICKDKDSATNLEKNLQRARRDLGLMALDNYDYEPRNMVEEVLYLMRWRQSELIDCPIEKLHEYEMALSSHILWVKAKENKWNTTYEINEKNIDRAINFAATRCSAGKTLKERRSEVINRYRDLQEATDKLELYKFYSTQCDKLCDIMIQMDNGLKKLIDTRRSELEKTRRMT